MFETLSIKRCYRSKKDNLDAMLYRELEKSPSGSQKTCSVSIEFEEGNTVYLVTRRCDYRKTEKKITPHEYQELSYYNNKGELSI